jgi:hypothetical protein
MRAGVMGLAALYASYGLAWRHVDGFLRSTHPTMQPYDDGFRFALPILRHGVM